MNGFFKGKVYGTVTVGERGQVVIPAEIRKSLNIKSGDKLIVIAEPHSNRKMIGLIPAENFTRFLNQAAKVISKLERKVSKKSR